MGFLIIIFAGFIAFCFAGAWWAMVYRSMQDISTRFLGLLLLQLSLSSVVATLLLGGQFLVFLALAFPPAIFLSLFALPTFGDIVQISGGILPFITTIAFIFLILSIKFLRQYWLILGTVILLISFIGYGEIQSRKHMCEQSANLNISKFKRHSFFWSIHNAPREYQFGIHAILTLDEELYGWSYKARDWYAIPESAAKNVSSGKLFDCEN